MKAREDVEIIKRALIDRARKCVRYVRYARKRRRLVGRHETVERLEKYLDYENGFSIEVGANDGYSQSNTYYFERKKGWSGILIEGIPELYEKCKHLRTGSRVFNCACVSDGFEETHVRMRYANLMSLVEGARGDEASDRRWVEEGLMIQKLKESYVVPVRARTLTSVLDECNVAKIDLFSLDVEGYEVQVLKGLDLGRYRPRYMCIEACRERKEIEDILLPYYDVVEVLSKRDVLYKARWDAPATSL